MSYDPDTAEMAEIKRLRAALTVIRDGARSAYKSRNCDKNDLALSIEMTAVAALAPWPPKEDVK